VHVALATDNVPPSLFWPVWQAVARVGSGATNRTIAPAPAGFRARRASAPPPSRAPYLTFEEDQKGSIEPGSSPTSRVCCRTIIFPDERARDDPRGGDTNPAFDSHPPR